MNSSKINLDTFLPHMRDVNRCEQSLRELSLTWRMIEASAKMNCPVEAHAIIPTMAATRAGFDRLEQELVNSLVQEKISNVLDEIGTKAQNVIDIVVRNLYERTADVGFLATDHELCAYVAGLHEDAAAIRERLQAYRRKYTVYDEILLLDTSGSVLMQIDDYMQVEGSKDALIAQTLMADDYVETFRATDLRPGKRKALIYSRKMLHPETNEVVGLLCLSFNFEEEMAGIFHSHRDPAERSNMLLLDGSNRVIASADPLWMPLGAQVPVNHGSTPLLMMFGGREYLVRTFYTEGYQNYKGPQGWQGQVMVPVEVAFIGAGSNALSGIAPEVSEGLLSHAQTFCPPLYAIMNAAETIRRVVWNGQVMTAGQQGDMLKLKTVLDQISETGERSDELFSHSIRDLYETVIGSSMRDAEFASHLLVDLLDRNLYERANDCRWWALTPALRALLASDNRNNGAVDEASAILSYINQLYTVYTRLFIYDRSGRIIASTHPASRQDMSDTHALMLGKGHQVGASIVGSNIDESTLQSVLALRTEQDYYVTPFATNTLYEGRHTYVYHAAIRHPDSASVVGGIGIVFDAEPEFEAMLRGGLGDRSGVNAFFIDRGGSIISSTDPSRTVGSKLEIDPDLLAMPNDQSASRIVLHDGHYAVMGCTVSSGYREFKVSDAYDDDVIAVVFKNFGEIRKTNAAGQRRHESVLVEEHGRREPGIEFATFFIDDDLYALPADSVREAFPGSHITIMSMGERAECVGMLALPNEVIWVFDLGHLIRGTQSVIDSTSQVLVVQYGGYKVGLLVTELHGVPEFSAAQIVPTPLAQLTDGMLVPSVIKANNGRLLIQAIDIICLFNLMMVGQVISEREKIG
ncbi:MAG: chemotaxis protein CheW [Oxalobacter sp.]|nr:MAG: chemotaxis protein CheW [Oxalobacter sp.]